MKGSRPPPSASFSLTVTDEEKVVMLGGHILSGNSSEAHILHLPTMVSQLFNTDMVNKTSKMTGKFQKIT